MKALLEPFTLGQLKLENRIVMAPCTRARAKADGVPAELTGTYYSQRSTMGLIITEGVNVSPNSCAFERAPGIWTDAQVEAWKDITQQVHDAGGRIYMQLWHCGRIGATGILQGKSPLSPSGVNDDLPQLGVYGLLANGSYAPLLASESREMSTEEIHSTVEEYKSAAANAMAAGFDGVEIHAANGYLPHQFLSPTLNQRADEYGGSVENRARFLRQVFEAIATVMPKDHIGVRISPYALYNNTRDPDPAATYAYVSKMLDQLGAGYLHFADMNGWFGNPDLPKILEVVRPNYRGPIIANGGITPEQGSRLIESGDVQMIAFGRHAMANPDLADRLRNGVPLAEVKATGWYSGGAEGYTDYPAASAR